MTDGNSSSTLRCAVVGDEGECSPPPQSRVLRDSAVAAAADSFEVRPSHRMVGRSVDAHHRSDVCSQRRLCLWCSTGECLLDDLRHVEGVSRVPAPETVDRREQVLAGGPVRRSRPAEATGRSAAAVPAAGAFDFDALAEIGLTST